MSLILIALWSWPETDPRQEPDRIIPNFGFCISQLINGSQFFYSSVIIQANIKKRPETFIRPLFVPIQTIINHSSYLPNNYCSIFNCWFRWGKMLAIDHHQSWRNNLCGHQHLFAAYTSTPVCVMIFMSFGPLIHVFAHSLFLRGILKLCRQSR